MINQHDYTNLELITFGVGCFLWVMVYFFTLRSIRLHRFVEIPIVTIWGNIVWEFLWSWVFVPDMGSLFVWGYRVWFFMDCFIVYGAIRFGYKQISVPLFRQHVGLLTVLGILGWLPLLYYYIAVYDAPLSHMGAYSGYLLNILISALYITQALRLNNWALFSYPAAWCKGVGTLLISIFCFLHFTDPFLLSMCVITAILDGAYIVLFTRQSTHA
ncbi:MULTISPECIES: hypothetical protein [unclassified Spirosoma]|uniref:transmembrane-type terpene cyclase n=1 Tax=unclassified Spirosoma TaxID=2621999 RepID=UPI00095DA599|nr:MULTISPECIES: hypothetical protein [unclassified Spirosoma]MBN8823478.1 hypothetical protein [Spirosoma sp.]OJW71912.1 MAG: hypothetical protein BGO59_16855 [Spirosoma sp. 48-14]